MNVVSSGVSLLIGARNPPIYLKVYVACRSMDVVSDVVSLLVGEGVDVMEIPRD